MKFLITSNNPVKMTAAKSAINAVFANETHEFTALGVDSGVADQPMTNDETLTGAYNRAKNAFDHPESESADYAIGIEGGLETIGGQLYAMAWVTVRNRDGRIGKARTNSFILPPKVARLVHEGKELGEADDIVFGQNNSKQKMGASGLLTNGLIPRATLYSPAIILAFIPFINSDHFTAQLANF